MDRAEKTGLGVAIVGHLALLAALSLGLLSTAKPPVPISDPIDVQLVDEVGLVSGAPEPSTEAPATSQAPDTGPPEEAAPAEPEPAPPEPTPTPPAPAPKPEPRPTPPPPAPKPKPAPPAPAPKPAPKPKPKPAPAEPKAAPAKDAPEKASPKASPASSPAKAKAGAGSGRKTTGAALGDDFLKGITPEKTTSRTQAPRAATVSATQMAGLVAAIQRQLLPCANRRSSPGPGSNRITTRMRLQFRKDGSLSSPPTVLGQTGTDDENSRYATRVGEQAISIARECSPLRLPAELYDVGNGQGWNDIVIRYKLPG